MMGCSSSSDNSNTTSSPTNEAVVTFVQADSLASTIKAENKNILIVDVRDDNEYNAGYIKDAINIPSAQFDDDGAKSSLLEHIKSSEKKTIVFHCAKSQVRGPTCAKKFQSYIDQVKDKSFDIQVLEGGYNNWQSLYGADETLTTKGKDSI